MLIIPAIDLRDGKCVRLTQGRRQEVKVYDGDPVLIARKFENAGARIALLYGDEWPQLKIKNLATREESLIPSDALLDSVAKFFTLSGSV